MNAIRVNSEGVMQRPTRYDECVKRRAAELALLEVKEWLGKGFEATDEEIIEDLIDAIDEGDGLVIVERLKSHSHWDADSALVKILDEGFIDTAERELVEQWVKCLGVNLDIPIGTQVRFKNPKLLRMGTSGEVVKHYPKEAKYGVRTPDQAPTANWILLPEDVEVVV